MAPKSMSSEVENIELKGKENRGCVISLWRTLFYVIYCIILEVS